MRENFSPIIIVNFRTQEMHTDELREQLCREGLTRSELLPDPLILLSNWLDLAKQVEIKEPDAMVVSTIEDNQPWQRTVLLKHVDEKGLVFYTNYESRKAKQMASNHNVCVLLPWYALQRQIIVHGRVEKVEDKLSEQYFQSRSRGSQVGAWASCQSQLLESREILEKRVSEINQKHQQDAVLPLPPFWGGYRIVPTRFEFWQGRNDRLHDRFIYSRKESGWDIVRLYP